MQGLFRQVFLLFVCLCLVPGSALGVVTTIINDLDPGQPGAILEISNIKGRMIPPNLKVVLTPGQERKLTVRNVHSFTVSRLYGDMRTKYVVQCPKDPRVKDKITLRLVDIQSDSMPAGCRLERTGKWSRLDGTTWDDKPVTTRHSP